MNKVMHVLLEAQDDINYHQVAGLLIEKGVTSHFIDHLQYNNYQSQLIALGQNHFSAFN